MRESRSAEDPGGRDPEAAATGVSPGDVILLMGVSGVGKTAVGRRLAELLACGFHDADDAHPEANIHKMAAGVALTDEDRLPWLERVHTWILRHEAAGSRAVVACSALKASYRRRLLAGTRRTRVVYLRGDREMLRRRLRARRGHFFDPRLLDSQLATLEEPRDAVTVEAEGDVDEVAAAVVDALEIDGR